MFSVDEDHSSGRSTDHKFRDALNTLATIDADPKAKLRALEEYFQLAASLLVKELPPGASAEEIQKAWKEDSVFTSALQKTLDGQKQWLNPEGIITDEHYLPLKAKYDELQKKYLEDPRALTKMKQEYDAFVTARNESEALFGGKIGNIARSPGADDVESMIQKRTDERQKQILQQKTPRSFPTGDEKPAVVVQPSGVTTEQDTNPKHKNYALQEGKTVEELIKAFEDYKTSAIANSQDENLKRQLTNGCSYKLDKEKNTLFLYFPTQEEASKFINSEVGAKLIASREQVQQAAPQR